MDEYKIHTCGSWFLAISQMELIKSRKAKICYVCEKKINSGSYVYGKGGWYYSICVDCVPLVIQNIKERMAEFNKSLVELEKYKLSQIDSINKTNLLAGLKESKNE